MLQEEGNNKRARIWKKTGEIEKKRRVFFTWRKREWVRCGRCDGEIYEGAEYYQINGECVCRECLEEFAGHWFAPFG